MPIFFRQSTKHFIICYITLRFSVSYLVILRPGAKKKIGTPLRSLSTENIGDRSS
jgi:hypothetical protein